MDLAKKNIATANSALGKERSASRGLSPSEKNPIRFFSSQLAVTAKEGYFPKKRYINKEDLGDILLMKFCFENYNILGSTKKNEVMGSKFG